MAILVIFYIFRRPLATGQRRVLYAQKVKSEQREVLIIKKLTFFNQS